MISNVIIIGQQIIEPQLLLLLDFVVSGFHGDSFGFDQLVQLISFHFRNVHSLQFFAIGVIKEKFWTFSGNLFECSAFEFLLKVLVDEFLHLGELIQTSPSAGLDLGRMNFGIFSISL